MTFKEFNVMLKKTILLSALLLITVSLPVVVPANEPIEGGVGPLEIAGIAENAIGKRVSNYDFIDQDGNLFNLKGLGGRPFIVSFIYTACPHTCSLITGSLLSGVKKAKEKLGEDVYVLTIGFDTENDTPSRMKEYGLRFTDDFSRFKFLSADKTTIEDMTREFGFYYRKVEDGTYEHANMVSLVDSEGRIYRHIYGVTLKPAEIITSLKEMGSGKPSFGRSVIDTLKLFCSRYNPATGTYDFYYPYLIVMVTQFITLLSIFVLVWRKELSHLLTRIIRK